MSVISAEQLDSRPDGNTVNILIRMSLELNVEFWKNIKTHVDLDLFTLL